MITIVNCPTCHKKVEWKPTSLYRPFCSERCKQIDLGAWAAEKYTIMGSESASPSSEEDQSSPKDY